MGAPLYVEVEKQRQVVLGMCTALGPRFAATRCQIARRPTPDTVAAMCSFGLYAKPVTGLLHTCQINMSFLAVVMLQFP